MGPSRPAAGGLRTHEEIHYCINWGITPFLASQPICSPFLQLLFSANCTFSIRDTGFLGTGKSPDFFSEDDTAR